MEGKRIWNLFSGLLYCAMCDGPMHFVNKGGNNGKFLICDKAKRGLTDCFSGGYKYHEFEKSFLTFIKEAKLAQVVGQLRPDNNQHTLQDEISETEGRLIEAMSRRDKAFELFTGDPASEYLKGKIHELDHNVTELDKTLEEKKQLQIVISQREE